ncbi:hypothetical protein D3C85_1654940 [compost metagenome]
MGLNGLALGRGQVVAALTVIPFQLANTGLLGGAPLLQALHLLPELLDTGDPAMGG